MTITTTEGQQQDLAKDFFLNNLHKFASDMQMVYELEKACAGSDHPICLGIKTCLKDQLPLDIILSNIRAMAVTSFDGVADRLGIELTNKILAS